MGPTPGEQARETLAERSLSESEADRILRRRMEAGSFVPWPLQNPAVEETARKQRELGHSPLVLSPVQKREREEALLLDAAAQILDASTCDRIATRLEETAALLLDAADDEGATAAIQIARRIREADAPAQVGFLRELLDLSLKLAARQLGETEKTQLIVPV